MKMRCSTIECPGKERLESSPISVGRSDFMSKDLVLVSPDVLPACTYAPIALRDMGSFHVGGRDVEISGKPVKEVVFTPGGVPAKVDLNGTYSVEAMYVQYFLPANRRGAVPLLMWHGGGLTGVTYETTPDGREGWLNFFVKQGWDTYNSDARRRGPTRSRRSSRSSPRGSATRSRRRC